MQSNNPSQSNNVSSVNSKKKSKKQKLQKLKPNHRPIIDQEEQNFNLNLQVLQLMQQLNKQYDKQKHHLQNKIEETQQEIQFDEFLMEDMKKLADILIVRNVARQYLQEQTIARFIGMFIGISQQQNSESQESSDIMGIMEIEERGIQNQLGIINERVLNNQIRVNNGRQVRQLNNNVQQRGISMSLDATVIINRNNDAQQRIVILNQPQRNMIHNQQRRITHQSRNEFDAQWDSLLNQQRRINQHRRMNQQSRMNQLRRINQDIIRNQQGRRMNQQRGVIFSQRRGINNNDQQRRRRIINNNMQQSRLISNNPQQTRIIISNPQQTRIISNNPQQTRIISNNPQQARLIFNNNEQRRRVNNIEQRQQIFGVNSDRIQLTERQFQQFINQLAREFNGQNNTDQQ